MTRLSLDKDRIKILLLEGIHPSAVQTLRQAGYSNIEALPTALEGEELKARIRDVHILGIRSRTQLTAEVLELAPKLMAIGCFCIGTNQVDLATAQRRGIPVWNAPFSNTRSVAELVLAEVILLLRDIPAKNAAAHRGGWIKSAAGSREARGKVLGIIGYGHIGTQIGLLAESLGMQVVFYDIVTKLSLGNATCVRNLDALLEQADVVTLHVPETPQTHGMFGREQIARMKRGASLINASRGTVVDLEAVAAALDTGHLAGAAIDVFPQEPESNKEPFTSPLLRFDNVILTPHIGGSTIEAQQNIGGEVAEKLLRYSNNGSTLTSVNFPEVSLPEHAGRHRLLHIHRNQPGVMSAINRVFSDSGINISAQYLQTNDRTGYVVIDVDAEYSELALKRLQEIPATLRARALF
jgi:D-3-phosphoglycerate dehydrogenase